MRGTCEGRAEEERKMIGTSTAAALLVT